MTRSHEGTIGFKVQVHLSVYYHEETQVGLNWKYLISELIKIAVYSLIKLLSTKRGEHGSNRINMSVSNLVLTIEVRSVTLSRFRSHLRKPSHVEVCRWLRGIFLEEYSLPARFPEDIVRVFKAKSFTDDRWRTVSRKSFFRG